MTLTPQDDARILDPLSALLAAYTHAFPATIGIDDAPAATRVIIDSLAVALGGLTSPAAVAARRYARNVHSAGNCSIWGTTSSTTPEIAALVNGVPLRAYDFNDLYVGKADSGHPSDMVPALIAVAEHKPTPGPELLAALSLGYTVTIALLDSCRVSPQWDYPNLVALGATCAIAKLLGLSETETAEALGITVVSHAASGEIESGDLNRSGNLTMWKRFNGSDAMRQSIYACLLAQAGVEGPVRPFVGKYGFLRILGHEADVLERLSSELARTHSWIGDSTFKRWPVGSRAQSAVQATLEARAGVTDIEQVREIRVVTNPETFHHLVAVRADPWAPISRETADHSLPYIVGAAVLDGKIDVQSFDPAIVTDQERRAFIQSRVRVESASGLATNDATYPSSVQIEMVDGRICEGIGKPPLGHRLHPFDNQAIAQKFVDGTAAFLGERRARAVVRELWSISDRSDSRDALAAIDFAIVDGDDAHSHERLMELDRRFRSR